MNTSGLIRALYDLIYPSVCPVCDRVTSRFAADICPDCQRRLSFVGRSYCMTCGKPVDEADEYCADCKGRRHIYDEGRSLLVYDEYASASVYRFKYRGRREYAACYARLMHERLERKIRSWDPDVMIPVPVHKSRLKKRGYNQAALIADELAKRTGIPVDKGLILRKVATGAQKNLSAAERQKNLKKAFIATGNVVKYRTVLIVDDIYTTGATMDALAAVLKDAGIRKVYFVTLCIGRGI